MNTVKMKVVKRNDEEPANDVEQNQMMLCGTSETQLEIEEKKEREKI